jgi:hypothetical protein
MPAKDAVGNLQKFAAHLNPNELANLVNNIFTNGPKIPLKI